jgi:hypothetical protein
VAKDSRRAPSSNRTATPAGSAASGLGSSGNGVVPYLYYARRAVPLSAGVMRIVRTVGIVRTVRVVLGVHRGRCPSLLHHKRGSLDRGSILRRDGSMRRDSSAGRECRDQNGTPQAPRYPRNDTTARKQINHTLARARNLQGALPSRTAPTLSAPFPLSSQGLDPVGRMSLLCDPEIRVVNRYIAAPTT